MTEQTATQKIRTGELTNIINSKNLYALREYLNNTPRDIVMKKDENGRDALYDAVFTGDVHIIDTLITYGFDPMNIDKLTGATALHLSASEAHFDAVVLLSDVLRLNTNATDNDGFTPLYYAFMFLINEDGSISEPHLDAAWALVRNGAKFQPKMLGLLPEIEQLHIALIKDIHVIMRKNRQTCLKYVPNMIKFLQDSLNTYSDFCKQTNGKSDEEIEKIIQTNFMSDTPTKPTKNLDFLWK